MSQSSAAPPGEVRDAVGVERGAVAVERGAVGAGPDGAASGLDAAGPDLDAAGSGLDAAGPDLDAAGAARELARPLQPLVAWARRRAFALPEFTRAARVADLDAVWQDVAGQLSARLLRRAARVLTHELAAARVAGALPGATPRDRFTAFVDDLTRPGRLAALLDRYPVLARLLTAECERSGAVVAELLARLVADHAELTGTVLPDGGPLVAVDLGAGDRHDGGRSVAVLRFAAGGRLVYKPRSIRLHEAWNGLLTWFGERRPDLRPRAVGLVARDGYGWLEHVPAVPCRSVREVELFYRRQGALLALLYALDATDIHCENLVACGPQPVVVDVETLFHPSWRPRTDHGDDPAHAALLRSVTRTALLPWLLFGGSGALDVSAIGASPSGPAAPGWLDAGLDTMRPAPAGPAAAGRASVPRLGNVAVDPLEYAASLQSGFTCGYETIMAGADDLSRSDGPLSRFAGRQIRVVARATRTYGELLDEASRPAAMRDPDVWAHAFDALARAPGQEHLRGLVEPEVAALRAGDVPLFVADADGRRLSTADGRDTGLLLADSGLARAAAKVARMNPADLRVQQWLVAATLATKRPWPARHRAAAPWPHPVPGAPIDPSHLLALACGIGDELIASSVRDERRANWVGLELLDGRYWTVAQLGAGLAEGYLGVALFLAQLAVLAQAERYRAAAAAAVAPLPRLVAGLAGHPQLARQVGPGAFFGLGGLCYGAARLGLLLDDDALRECAGTGLVALAASAGDPGAGGCAGDPGVGSGLAGGLAAARAVSAITGDPAARALADRFSRRLTGSPGAVTAVGPGFLAGRAGIAWALRSAGAAGPGRAAPDEADEADAGIDPDDLGWCRGAAGDVIAAAGASGGGVAADRFLAAAAARVPGRDQSLCHGELGILDTVIELARTGHAGAESVRQSRGQRLVGSVERYGVQCGTPDAVPTPGLLYGTAGIGYGLLRLGFADRVPSLLRLGC